MTDINSVLLEGIELQNKVFMESLINEKKNYLKEYWIVIVKVIKGLYEAMLTIIQDMILKLTVMVDEIFNKPIVDMMNTIHYDELYIKSVINLNKLDIFFIGNRISTIIDVLEKNKKEKDLVRIAYTHLTGDTTEKILSNIVDHIESFYMFPKPIRQKVTESDFLQMRDFILGNRGMTNITLGNNLRRMKLKIKKSYKESLLVLDQEYKSMSKSSSYDMIELDKNRQVSINLYKNMFDIATASVSGVNIVISKYMAVLLYTTRFLYEHQGNTY